MSENTNCFTFFWKIKNFSFYCRKYCIDSPSFFVQAMADTKWHLLLYPSCNIFTDCVVCYFQRDDPGPDQYEIDYELSFLSSDGSVLHSKKFLGKVYRKGDVDWKLALNVKRDEIFLLKKDLYIPDDTLNVRCRMWDRQKPMSQPGRCFAETQIETECRSFIGTIKKFRGENRCRQYPIHLISSKNDVLHVLTSMELYVAADGKEVIQIKVSDSWLNPQKYICIIFIIDILGNKIELGQAEFHDTNSHSIRLTRLKEHVMGKKNIYNPLDSLTIESKFIIPTGKMIEKIIEPEYGFEQEDVISNIRKTNLLSGENHIENLTLNDDWFSVYNEGYLCDLKLKTATETFSAHKIVLCARSPVFKAMFTTDMKEKINKCVDIDDLDADTVRRMLLFMYSDTLENLEYDSAKNLYFAADKYNILSLRQGCSNFLKQNLMDSNCCDILLLADQHQDEDLKITVQDYIVKHDKVVLFSVDWKNLENNHSRLTTEVLRFVYLKIRNN